jgi:hypothetical protein
MTEKLFKETTEYLNRDSRLWSLGWRSAGRKQIPSDSNTFVGGLTREFDNLSTPELRNITCLVSSTCKRMGWVGSTFRRDGIAVEGSTTRRSQPVLSDNENIHTIYNKLIYKRR